ncbi:MAG: histidinol dehydrogenase, partial [Terriglobales bacterium]
MQLLDQRDTAALDRLLRRSAADLARAGTVATRIIRDIRRDGDQALVRWTKKLDKIQLVLPSATPAPIPDPASLFIGPEAMRAAWQRTPPGLRRALRHAHRNIVRMAGWQMPRAWARNVQPGVRLGQVVRPLDSVGCYVPAGRPPQPTTLLMTAATARRAGVPRVVIACPHPDDTVLAAAHLAGADGVYRMGGAQAIAALAYGTPSVPKVAKIVGPGNVFVTAAKRLIAPDCGIDFLAGPTEVLLIASAGADPEFLAADLIAQSEHDPQATAWLVTDSRALGRQVIAAVARQLQGGWNPVAAASLENRGAVIVTRSLADAVALANRLAPEHITVPPALLPHLDNAGSIFLGDYAPQAVGDYLSGANHVLPTATEARRRGGLSVLDFVKIMTVQHLTRAGLAALAPSITTLARAEGLEAHARSVEQRLQPRNPKPTAQTTGQPTGNARR